MIKIWVYGNYSNHFFSKVLQLRVWGFGLGFRIEVFQTDLTQGTLEQNVATGLRLSCRLCCDV